MHSTNINNLALRLLGRRTVMIRTFKNLAKKSSMVVGAYQGLRFAKNVSLKDCLSFRKLHLLKKISPYTMVGYSRLSSLYDLSNFAEKNKMKGAFVECGVWKGGSAAIMAYAAEKAKSSRKIWLFDSFEGLPEPTEKDGIRAREYASNKASGKLSSINQCVGPLEDLEKLFFSVLKLDKKNIVIKKGWFQETLPKAKKEIGDIAILRLDGDWYESTKCCLENLYGNVISGGYVVIDDYGCWEGCRKAVDEFLRKNKINVNLNKIDSEGAYFEKP